MSANLTVLIPIAIIVYCMKRNSGCFYQKDNWRSNGRRVVAAGRIATAQSLNGRLPWKPSRSSELKALVNSIDNQQKANDAYLSHVNRLKGLVLDFGNAEEVVASHIEALGSSALYKDWLPMP